jgi:uncharacterized membrane protein YuzA (DUF378 family)
MGCANKTVYWVAMLLVLVGALNWGAVAVLEKDAVKWLLSLVGLENKDNVENKSSVVSRVVFGLVAVAALVIVFYAGKKIMSQADCPSSAAPASEA